MSSVYISPLHTNAYMNNNNNSSSSSSNTPAYSHTADQAEFLSKIQLYQPMQITKNPAAMLDTTSILSEFASRKPLPTQQQLQQLQLQLLQQQQQQQQQQQSTLRTTNTSPSPLPLPPTLVSKENGNHKITTNNNSNPNPNPSTTNDNNNNNNNPTKCERRIIYRDKQDSCITCHNCTAVTIENKTHQGCDEVYCPICINPSKHLCKFPGAPWVDCSRHKLFKAKVFCFNSEYGCKENITEEELPEHLLKCTFRCYKCTNCDEPVLRTEKENHDNVCKPVVLSPAEIYKMKADLSKLQAEMSWMKEEFKKSLSIPAVTPITATPTTATITTKNSSPSASTAKNENINTNVQIQRSQANGGLLKRAINQTISLPPPLVASSTSLELPLAKHPKINHSVSVVDAIIPPVSNGEQKIVLLLRYIKNGTTGFRVHDTTRAIFDPSNTIHFLKEYIINKDAKSRKTYYTRPKDRELMGLFVDTDTLLKNDTKTLSELKIKSNSIICYLKGETFQSYIHSGPSIIPPNVFRTDPHDATLPFSDPAVLRKKFGLENEKDEDNNHNDNNMQDDEEVDGAQALMSLERPVVPDRRLTVGELMKAKQDSQATISTTSSSQASFN